MIALLSDIHSNLYALEAVLSDMPKVSAVYVLGDMIGGASPFPCEVLDTLMGPDVPVHAIIGNWEGWMLGARHNIPPEIRGNGTKLAAGAWAMDVLQERHWNYLEGLEKTLHVNDMLLFHGSPERLKGEILCQKDAEELAQKHDAKWLIGGHIHRTQLFKVGTQRVVNAGSVGISCDNIGGVACYALFDGDDIVFRHVAYDVESAIKAIEASELYTLSNDFVKTQIAVMRNGNYE